MKSPCFLSSLASLMQNENMIRQGLVVNKKQSQFALSSLSVVVVVVVVSFVVVEVECSSETLRRLDKWNVEASIATERRSYVWVCALFLLLVDY